MRKNIGDVECGQFSRVNVVRGPKTNQKKKKEREKFQEKMSENFPEPRKDSNPHIQEALQNLSTIKTKKVTFSLIIENLMKPNGKI